MGRVVIPGKAARMVLQLLHANHSRMTAMKADASTYVWWPKMGETIEDFFRECLRCQKNNTKQHICCVTHDTIEAEPLEPSIYATQPIQTVSDNDDDSAPSPITSTNIPNSY